MTCLLVVVKTSIQVINGDIKEVPIYLISPKFFSFFDTMNIR